MIVWRTDGQVFEVGEVIQSRGDHWETLNHNHREAEILIREGMVNGAYIRSKSLYTWKDMGWANKTWEYQKEKYLYKLEVNESHIFHIGDVTYYTAIGDALTSGGCPQGALKSYLDGAQSEHPRIEILVAQATVIERLSYLDIANPEAAPA